MRWLPEQHNEKFNDKENTMKVYKIIASLLFSAMLTFSTQGCAGPGTTKDSLTISIPEYTAMVVLFDAEGKPTILDREGKPLPPCQFCDEALEKKLGRGCEGAKEYNINICPGTLSTQIKSVTPISLLRHKGSGCYTTSTGGYNSGVCYVLCRTFPTYPGCN